MFHAILMRVREEELQVSETTCGTHSSSAAISLVLQCFVKLVFICIYDCNSFSFSFSFLYVWLLYEIQSSLRVGLEKCLFTNLK